MTTSTWSESINVAAKRLRVRGYSSVSAWSGNPRDVGRTVKGHIPRRQLPPGNGQAPDQATQSRDARPMPTASDRTNPHWDTPPCGGQSEPGSQPLTIGTDPGSDPRRDRPPSITVRPCVRSLLRGRRNPHSQSLSSITAAIPGLVAPMRARGTIRAAYGANCGGGPR
jgi:hypothetical protein